MLNGSKGLLLIGDDGDYSTIAGQLEITAGFNGVAIDVTSKSNSDFVTMLDGELSSKGETVTGSLVYSNDTSARTVRAKQVTHAITDFKLSFNDATLVDLYMSGIVSGLSDNLAKGDKVVSSFTLNTIGEVFRAWPYYPIGSDGYLTSDNKQYFVRI